MPKSDRRTLMTEQLDLTDEETRALIALLREFARIRALPARAAPRPAESDPGEAGTSGAFASRAWDTTAMTEWLHDILLAGGTIGGALAGGWLTRASSNRQWRRDRCLEAYADVLRTSGVVTMPPTIMSSIICSSTIGLPSACRW